MTRIIKKTIPKKSIRTIEKRKPVEEKRKEKFNFDKEIDMTKLKEIPSHVGAYHMKFSVKTTQLLNQLVMKLLKMKAGKRGREIIIEKGNKEFLKIKVYEPIETMLVGEGIARIGDAHLLPFSEWISVIGRLIELGGVTSGVLHVYVRFFTDNYSAKIGKYNAKAYRGGKPLK